MLALRKFIRRTFPGIQLPSMVSQPAFAPPVVGVASKKTSKGKAVASGSIFDDISLDELGPPETTTTVMDSITDRDLMTLEDIDNEMRALSIRLTTAAGRSNSKFMDRMKELRNMKHRMQKR